MRSAPALLLIAVGLLAAAAASGGNVVRIGVAGSFSDPIGLPMKQAAELAAEEINASGGINGRRLELVARDDYADPDSAVFVASDLYDSDVSAVVGHLFSGMTLAAAPVYNGGRDPVVGHQPLVFLARRDRRRQLHLPRLSQRPGARHRAGPLGARPAPPHPRRGALPQ